MSDESSGTLGFPSVDALLDFNRNIIEEFRANGVDVSEAEDKPWGFREFGVLTIDGHRFMFVQRLEESHSNDAE